MKHTQSVDFDPDFYFGLVAENLIKNFGTRALFYADEALRKMRALGDDEGFDLWMSIHEHLSQRAAEALGKDLVCAAAGAAGFEGPVTVH